MDNLDTFLEGEPVEAVEAAPEPEATQQPEAVETPPSGPERGPDGKFKAKGTEDAMPASEEGGTIPLKGYMAEKQKRQEYEARVADLERQLAERSQPKEPEAPPAPPPSIWEDEQGFNNHIVSQAVQQASLNARLDMSEMMVRQANPDFEEVKAEFLEMGKLNPTLVQEALADPHPWNKAYQIAKNARTMKDLGATNIDELKASLLEQLKAEQAQEAVAKKLQIPQSLAGEQSARSSGAAAFAGPTPLEEIFPAR